MIRLHNLASADSEQLPGLIKQQLEKVDGTLLPLQQGLTRSSYTDAKAFSVTVLNVSISPDLIRARVGVFYKGIVAGCNCADDPAPVPEIDEYCELELDIDPASGETDVRLVD